MYIVTNTVEGKEMGRFNEAQFIEFVRNIAKENGDEKMFDLKIDTIEMAVIYIKSYCENLEFVEKSYKVWMTIEERTFNGTSEDYVDVQDETISAGEFNTVEEATKRMEEIHATFGGDFK